MMDTDIYFLIILNNSFNIFYKQRLKGNLF